ncbi:hypothetical protein HX045_10935 [Myroides odoratimimus]|uniref:Uncharacterized protein n=3 Tax=Myroides odoratimimus TaxID=76832 RepID=A0A0S7EBK8_9FLAO|nr:MULTISPECIES: hypothetical protein [Myroides]AJA68965.1 hypothetical protein MYRA21_1820 [Myroides sp. A21]ALU26210.1 hypothetical protein AS202_08640 [Myroides odoratimimus]APA92261.1 hypothetical protein BK054_08505 [Myroides sp. ZB35]EHO12315.1 hypothetical protein HMPREF9712_00562 [Myroides odoratimimus CCUG 10230]EHO13792.1 hypothetical protein HMPREF9714_00717 [Myroides odoratimimus CCUG 12901]
MKALRIIPFFYLFIAVLFIYDGVSKIVAGDTGSWLSFLIAAVAIFMFFFRRKFLKKMDGYNKK